MRIGMALYGDVEHDSRVRRAAASLVGAGHSVVIGSLGYNEGEARRSIDGANAVPVRPRPQWGRLPGDESPIRSRRRAGRIGPMAAGLAWLFGYGSALWSWRREMLREMPPADVWHGHDLFGLWVAAALSRRDRAGLVYDSHELFLESGSAVNLPRLARSALARLERHLARSAAVVITVNPSIASELQRRYGVLPRVVMNVPRDWPAEPAGPFPAAEAARGRDVVLFHGALSPGRGVEQLASIAPALPAGAVVVLLGDGPLYRTMAELAATASHADRLLVYPAVSIASLPAWVRGASVGVIAFQPTNLNNVLATPNKLFDYLMSGVPVVVSDFPELRRIVGELDAGLTCDPSDPGSILRSVTALLAVGKADAARRRERIASDSRTRFSWASQEEILLGVYRDLGRRQEQLSLRHAGS